MSIDELSDAYHQFEEREMPKTVTVEVELPEGVEYAGTSPHRSIAIPSGTHACVVTSLPVRPIATEKTWERPEWMSRGFSYLTHDDSGWWFWQHKPERVGNDWSSPHDLASTRLIAKSVYPSIDDLEPAARIWRIVERGEG